ncbi:MAG: Cof-type HAD-IIB family hydrolase [Nakamurella sp.]
MSPQSESPLLPPVFDPRPDIRLIVADMDGTLLDDDKLLHEHFWPLIEELHSRGILFCPASGRQYFTLLREFADIADDVVFIAENGAYVVYQGREVSSDVLPSADVERMISTIRDSVAGGLDTGVVLCGKRSAYIERTDERFLEHVEPYIARLVRVDDLLAVDDDEIVKVSAYDFVNAEAGVALVLSDFVRSHTATVSGTHWLDITSRTANKGAAIRHLQESFQITPDQTMVFGDYLNDLEMMDAASYSFAMHNAHPLLRERARYVAPPNSENGVVRTISAVLGLPWSG